jgi:penicillin-binding protein 1A
MQTDRLTKGKNPDVSGADQDKKSLSIIDKKREPAHLPEYSQAAAAQRLNDAPEQPIHGVHYEVPHLQIHPTGWRTKRYIKRKNLRETMAKLAKVERIGTRTMLPLAGSIFSVFLITVIVFITVTGFINATSQKYEGSVITLQDILPKDSLKAYDTHETLIYQMIDQGSQTSVPLNKISPHLAHAEIAIEDQNFYKNAGYDITGIVRAAIDDLTSNRVVSGGSTITQQLIKNTIVGNQTTALRKLQEIILAPDVTRHYSKDQILNMYLNTTYYGEQAYGAEAAAFTYFGLQDTLKTTAAAQLDIAQSAMLAGIPSSPIARDPLLHPQAGNTRAQEVLQQMYVQGYINAREKAAAIQEMQQPNFFKPGIINNRLAPHFINYALKELANDLHVKIGDLSRSGLVVTTTLDLNLQNRVLKDAQMHIQELAKAHHMSNAAVVVIDYHTGAIRTMLGNIDPNNPQDGDFDVASQGFRQPGSSFKPFIYATAFQEGVSPGDIVMDEPLTVPQCCGLPSYSPLNYDLKFHGPVTYRYALQNSFNIPAVKLLMQTGVAPALKTAQDMGIGDYLGVPNYTMVLGSLSVHLLDETTAYGTFADQGIRVQHHAIDIVTDTQGHVILHISPPGKEVLSKQAAFMTTDVLSDNNARVFEFGRCSALLLYSSTTNDCYAGKPGTIRPSAAKTGTSNDFRDNWTMGYTSDFVVGVWAGNNDNSAMVNITGVDGAAPIWHDTMLMAEQGHPIVSLPGPPAGVMKKTVGAASDWYLKK